jgi:hypothetical protein
VELLGLEIWNVSGLSQGAAAAQFWSGTISSFCCFEDLSIGATRLPCEEACDVGVWEDLEGPTTVTACNILSLAPFFVIARSQRA